MGLAGCGEGFTGGFDELGAGLSRNTDAVRPSEPPVGRLTIPAIGLHDIPIFDRGPDAHGMMRVAGGLAVTHYGPSGLLDGNSNAVLYGHDDIEGSVFGSLASLKPGDTIYLTPTGGSQLAYTVSDGPRRVSPTTTSILAPSASPRLTLFTCYPTYVDTQRVYVVAAPSHGG